MSSQALSEVAMAQEQVANDRPGDNSMDDKINILRETVLQLLQEVESLTIAAPTGLKSGARLDEEVR